METQLMDMKKEYKPGQLIFVSVGGRYVPAEYIQRRGLNHEVLVSPKYLYLVENAPDAPEDEPNPDEE